MVHVIGPQQKHNIHAVCVDNNTMCPLQQKKPKLCTRKSNQPLWTLQYTQQLYITGGHNVGTVCTLFLGWIKRRHRPHQPAEFIHIGRLSWKVNGLLWRHLNCGKVFELLLHVICNNKTWKWVANQLLTMRVTQHQVNTTNFANCSTRDVHVTYHNANLSAISQNTQILYNCKIISSTYSVYVCLTNVCTGFSLWTCVHLPQACISAHTLCVSTDVKYQSWYLDQRETYHSKYVTTNEIYIRT